MKTGLDSSAKKVSTHARIAQLDRALDLKTRGCGFDSQAGKPNKYLLSFG